MNTIASIVSRARENGLPLLLAGGHAVIAHGHARNTFDLDLIVRRNDGEKWFQLATTFGYICFQKGPAFSQFNPPNDDLLPLDLMLVNDETFKKLSADATQAPSTAGDVKVVSLLHLLALKAHAIKHGDAGRIVKDVDDVIHLVQVNQLDVNRPDIQEIFLKYGTVDLYEKVKRAIGSY